MTTIQEQYTEFAQRGQESAMAIVEAWTESVQNLATQVPSAATQAAAHQVVDQTFEFFGKVLEMQRSAAKQFISASANAAEQIAQHTSDAVSEAGERFTQD